ncbi:MAG: transglycosylase domain-containing protein, partial [Spirochaetales bacterium]|nr:transglycosylase domain-containing protein [Spirochaetales bacterium]
MRTRFLYAGWAGSLIILTAVLLILRFLPYPELDSFIRQEYSLEIYDRNGILLKVTPLEEGLRRVYRNLDNIPDAVKRVFIIAEDSRFYFHPGVDPAAVFRAFFQNRSAGKIVSGASTISMQLARIISGRDGGYKAKLKEVFNAIRLESRLSKKQILELWLNNIPFSFQIEGVAAASLKFLEKELSSMDTESAMLLAVIPRSPAAFNPLQNKEAAISAAAELVVNSALPGIKKKNDIKDITDSLRKILDQKKGFLWPDITPHFSLYTEGQIESGQRTGRLDTTIDSHLNEILEDRINYYLSISTDSRITNGAGIIIDNISGEILAYVGSADFRDEANSGQIDGVQILNQPGSTLKPFLYALAIEEGFRPNSVLPDIPQQLGGPEAYLPMNFDRSFHGPVLLRVALASSMNVPAVYMINRLGVLNFADYLISLGFDSIRGQREYVGTGLALGNAEVSLMELTRAFSIFPGRGFFLPLTSFLTADLNNIDGRRQGDIDSSVMKPYTAGIITNILSDNNSRFPGFGNNSIMNTRFPGMFKTGTSNQFQNIWALGATPEYTVGIWMGDFSGNTVIGRTGSSLPAAIAAEILELIHIQGSVFDHVPDSSPISLCSLSGLRPNEYTPATYIEFLPAGDVPKVSDWHIAYPAGGLENQGVLTIYPEEYMSWLEVKDRSGMISRDNGIYKIVYPADNSV